MGSTAISDIKQAFFSITNLVASVNINNQKSATEWGDKKNVKKYILDILPRQLISEIQMQVQQNVDFNLQQKIF